jgi:hypothetical protein
MDFSNRKNYQVTSAEDGSKLGLAEALQWLSSHFLSINLTYMFPLG